MGCDIHAYVEYSTNGTHWFDLIENGGNRNYRMFAIMAGVRDYDGIKLFDAKGMPEGPVSYAVEKDHWLRIVPENHPEWADSDGWTSKGSAESWVADGYSTPVFKDDVLERVTNPDHHSHSWLSSDELEQCIERYKELFDGKAPTEWVAILASMKAIEGNGDKARLIFWFDN